MGVAVVSRGGIGLSDDRRTDANVVEVDSGVGSLLNRVEWGIDVSKPTSISTPTPVPDVPAVPSSTPLSRQSAIESLICSYSWDCATALAIVYGPTAACPTGESAGRWDAVGDGSYGGFQIQASVWVSVFTDFWEGDPPNWSRPEWNIAHAYRVYLASAARRGDGWLAWSCY